MATQKFASVRNLIHIKNIFSKEFTDFKKFIARNLVFTSFKWISEKQTNIKLEYSYQFIDTKHIEDHDQIKKYVSVMKALCTLHSYIGPITEIIFNENTSEFTGIAIQFQDRGQECNFMQWNLFMTYRHLLSNHSM